MKKTMVIASIVAAKTQKTSIPRLEMASHKCDQCGHKFSTQKAIASPFCVKCGGDTKQLPNAKSQDLSKVNTDSLTAVVCAGCSAHNVMHSETASTLGGKMNCVSCGVPLTYQVQSSEDGDDDMDDDYDLGTTKTGTETSDDDIPDSYDDDDDTLSGEDGDDLEPDDDEDDSDSDDGEDDSDSDDGEDDSDIEESDLEPDDDEDDSDGDEDDSDDEDEESDLGGDSFDDDEEPSMQLSALSLAKGKSRILWDGERILAFVGDVCVATLAANKTNKDVIHTPAYQSAINVAVANSGIKKALASYNFKMVNLPVDKSKIVGEEVASLVEDEKRKLNSKFKANMKALEQSLALAASGFNRDMFPDAGNPLKAALVDTLASVNIRNAASVVQSAFIEASDEYHQLVIAKALEYMQKPEEVRNELAKVMAGTTPSDLDDEDDDVGDQDEDDDIGDEDDEEDSSFQVRSALDVLAQPTRRVKGAKQQVKSSLFPKILG